MKFFKPLSILAVTFISAFVFTISSCGPKCSDPSIVFNPSSTTGTAAPGEKFKFDIIVTGTDVNIKSITVSKSSNGVTNSSFISVTSVGSKGKTVTVSDSVPSNVTYGSTITYEVTAISDCKAANSASKTYTLTVAPSSTPLDPLIYEVKNSQSPRVYSRFSSSAGNNSAWDLQNRLPKFAIDANADKDIRDSLNSLTGNPFTSNARWGSRNGSKFVKAPSSFDYANASAKSIVDAYKAGVATDLITISANDNIIVNIKNQNKYAVVNIISLTDDGAASYEDYTFFKYKLAQ